MDFDLGREQEDFRKRVRDFAEREIAPLVEEAEEKEAFPVHLFPRMGKEGLLCVRCPQQYGGPGLSKVCECLYMVELNRVCPGIAAALMVHGGLATDPILNSGTEEQKQRYLAPAAKGEMIGSFALTEPDAGSDAASIRTTAQKGETSTSSMERRPPSATEPSATSSPYRPIPIRRRGVVASISLSSKREIRGFP